MTRQRQSLILTRSVSDWGTQSLGMPGTGEMMQDFGSQSGRE